MSGLPPRADTVGAYLDAGYRRVKLKIVYEGLSRMHPADIADIVEDLPPAERARPWRAAPVGLDGLRRHTASWWTGESLTHPSLAPPAPRVVTASALLGPPVPGTVRYRLAGVLKAVGLADNPDRDHNG